MDKWKHMKE